MKSIKKTLILLFAGLSLIGYAQQFQLTNADGVPYIDGQTISATITEKDLDEVGDFITSILVKNISEADIEVRTLRTNEILVEGMFAYVCYYFCDESGELYAMECPIGAGESAPYELHLRPNDKFGLCKFQIDFMVPGESMTLFVEIKVEPLGINEQGTTASLSAYPNPAPANSTINVSYALADNSNNQHLVIRNIIGAEVINLPLNPFENNIRIDAALLKPGVYFYTLESNSRISVAKKLIIK
jgi:hypothetical protein